MVFAITVLYPTGSDATFDMDYYLGTHMPLVQENWGPMGLKSWRITKFAEPTATEHQYFVQAYLEFGSAGEFQKAADEKGPTVMGDIPKFTNKQPLILHGDIVASATV